MNWEQYYGALDQGRIQNVYCFYGPEEYVKAQALGALRNKLLPEGLEALNETILEGASAQQIIEAAETLPMMCERRLVVARDWAPLLAGKAKNEAAETDAMLSWLECAPDSCCLVFYVRGAPDGRKKLVQALQKRGAGVAFELLDDDKLRKWLQGQLKPLSVRMDRKAMDELVFLAGRELTRLAGEVQKLCAYVGERREIHVEDVRKLVPPSLESTVFQMIDRLMAGDQAGAQRLFKGMLESGENRVGVLFMLTRQLRNMTHVRRLRAEGVPMAEIEKRLGIARFVAQRVEAQARKFSLDGLEAGYRACMDAEFEIKSGRARDVLAVDRLMMTLGQMR